jgi:tetratricopeptide (TPR) repeat protein
MKRALGMFLVLWACLPGSLQASRNTADSVVRVVALNDQGLPVSQGLGVVISNAGHILTSAAMLTQSHRGVIKTGAGTLHIIQKVVGRDNFQDLALVQVDAEGLSGLAPAILGGLRSSEEVGLVDQGNPWVLQKARVTKTLPLSPRLVLLKVEPEGLASAPGTPLFNSRGELVGMLHAFGSAPGKASGLQFWLALDRQHSWLEKDFGLSLPDKGGNNPGQNFVSGCDDFLAGVVASLQQEWQVSLQKFTTALTVSENLPEAYYGRGVARYHLGDYDGAITDLTAATQRLPRYALAYLWLGKARDRRGNLGEAEKAYRQAVDTDPGMSAAWFDLGILSYRAGKLSQAEEYLKKAGDDFPLAAQRWWYLGVMAQSQQRWDEAVDDFNRAIQLDPALFQAYLEQGKILLSHLGKPKEALGFLEKAVSLQPQNGLAHYYLGLALLMSWNPAGAWEQYFALQELSPGLAASLAKTLEGN